MDLDIQTWMMIFFILLLIVSFYKIRQFLPQEQLADDDTTKEATKELESIVLRILNTNKEDLSTNELFELIKNDEEFDAKHFWRFNQNRLNHLLADLKTKS